MGYLDNTGLAYFWGKIKSRLLPSGGTTGQVLKKKTNTDYDFEWGNLGCMSNWDLLWTNASPNSIFADQTVAIDLTNYDMVLVYFTANVGAGPMAPVLAIKGETASAESIWSGWAAFRNFTPGDNGVVFDKGYYKSNFGSSSAETPYNNYIIPEKIYAAKCMECGADFPVSFQTTQIVNNGSKTINFGNGGTSTVVFVTGNSSSRMAMILMLCNTSGVVNSSITGSSGITVSQAQNGDFKGIISNSSGGTVYLLVANYRGNTPEITT